MGTTWLRRQRKHPRRWSARPWRARGAALLVYGLPIAGSLAFVRLATAITGAPTSSLGVFLLWWFAMSLRRPSSSRSCTRSPAGSCRSARCSSSRSSSRTRRRRGSGSRCARARSRASRSGCASCGRRRSAEPQEAAEILLQLVAALDVHDEITRGHAERVRAYAYSLGRQLGLSGDELDRLNWAALLHDIGKLEVSTEILNKPGKPTDEEWEQLRPHPLYGETLVEPLASGWQWTDAVGYHHERWDGKGYPRGHRGRGDPARRAHRRDRGRLRRDHVCALVQGAGDARPRRAPRSHAARARSSTRPSCARS